MSKDHAHHQHTVSIKENLRVASTRIKLVLSMPKDEIAAHRSESVKEIARSAKIPGFRPGKAPLAMVSQKFEKEIYQDLLSHLVDAAVHEGLRQTKYVPVDQPRIKLLSTLSADADFELEAEFEIQPEVELRKYKGIPVEQKSAEISDKDLDEALDSLRDRRSTLEPLEGEPSPGNFAVLEAGFETVDEPKIVEPKQPISAEIGTGKIFAELDKEVMSMKSGDERDVEVTFPDDYAQENLRGRKALFHCKVLEWKKKVLPDLDDAFAESFRSDLTLEGLRTELREQLSQTRKDESQQTIRESIIAYLVDNNTFEVAPSLVNRKTGELINNFMQRSKQKWDPKQGLPEEFVQTFRKEAERLVRGSLLLNQVATKEQIQIDEDKVKQRIQSIAKGLNRSDEETEKLLSGRQVLDSVRDEVLTDQVFEFLVEHAEKA